MARADRLPFGCAVLLATWVWSAAGAAQEPAQAWRQVPAAFHVHSTFSTGSDSFASLAAEAKASGIEAIFLTDNYLLRYEYGLFPFRGLIRRTRELPSVLQVGVDHFLAGVREAGLRHPEVTFIPGVEVVPHYYWTGSVFTKDLTMHDSQKNVLVLGLPTADDYTRLPAAGNRAAYQYGWMALVQLSPALLVPPAIWLLARRVDRRVRVGWTFIVVRSRRLAPGVALLLLAGLLLVNNYPFGLPLYDIYQDGHGLRPHQQLIDFVRERGGITVWSMPEARDFHRFDYGRLGIVTVRTDPYPDALVSTSGYTGFGAVYQDTTTVVNPAGVWDAALREYASGRRARPPWGFGEIAYHTAGSAGIHLYQVQTVLWVRERTPAALLDAVAKGRMYASQRTKEYGLVLNDFSLTSTGTGRTAMSGETLQADGSGAIRLRIAVAATDGTAKPVPVQVIRGGSVLTTLNETTPFSVTLDDRGPAAGETTYYRLLVGSRNPRIVTNPIFVRGPVGGEAGNRPRSHG
jgi:hypothetical protein